MVKLYYRCQRCGKPTKWVDRTFGYCDRKYCARARKAGYRDPGGSLSDEVGAPPEVGYFTCDTDKCQQYINAVSALSDQLNARFSQEVDLEEINVEQVQKLGTPDEKVKALEHLLELKQYYTSWLNARGEWLSKVSGTLNTETGKYEGGILLDCASTFTGPCKDAIGSAWGHEQQVVAFNKGLEDRVGKKTGITGIINNADNTVPVGDLPGFDGGVGNAVKEAGNAFKWLAIAIAVGFLATR